MKKLVVSGKEVIKVLLKIGFEVKRTKGSHSQLAKTVNGVERNVTVHVHGNRDLNPTVLRSIMRQSGLSSEEFERLFD